MGGLLHQQLQSLRGFVVVPQRVVDQGLIETDFQRVRSQGLGLFQGGKRLLVMTLPALDLRNPQIGLRVLRVGGRDGLKVLEGRA